MSSKKTDIYHSSSSAETKECGRNLAAMVMQDKTPREKGIVVALTGDLGAGKTTFVQGFAEGLGIKGRVTSPTYVIIRRHVIKKSAFKNLFHLDVYRIKTPQALAVLSFGEIIADPRNIVLIEWAEQVKELLPKDAFWVDFKHGGIESERTLTIVGYH
jgi:tRNA threonylcarbamoyladenosine biosynthesis protein TsaE